MRSFDQSLPMALLSAREAMMRAFRPMLGRHDLTEQQWRVLRALTTTTDGLEVGELAENTLLLGPSLSRIVANLVDRGVLTRTSREHDQRRALVALTPKGRSVVAAVGPASEAIYDQIETHIGSGRLAEVLPLLSDLAGFDADLASTHVGELDASH
ncbi:MAG: homoprotocatechuate degradation operon regulator HpaR [Actinobacteria bacterium]|nr:homoprotocatechuate degradation operon regulator HpaR [Actinomycetota bacterium]